MAEIQLPSFQKKSSQRRPAGGSFHSLHPEQFAGTNLEASRTGLTTSELPAIAPGPPFPRSLVPSQGCPPHPPFSKVPPCLPLP